MSGAQIKLLDASEITTVREPVAPPCDLYVVVAYLPSVDGVGRWSVREGEWLTQEAGERAARNLAPIWKHRHVVRIQIQPERA